MEDFKHSKKGLTLIETLVVVAIFTILMAAVSALIILTYRIQSYTWQQSIAMDEARKGVETMIKEIREARLGEDGSYVIEKAGDKEFVFHSDIDNDGKTERVRYFLATLNQGNQTKNCVTLRRGGSCSVSFSSFFTGVLKTAQVKISVEGDLGTSNEYVDIYADGQKIGTLCQTGCSDCAGAWQGTAIFDVINQAGDNQINFSASSSVPVDPNCNWQEYNHAMKAQFEFSWSEEVGGQEHTLKKGVIEPTAPLSQYPPDQEKITILSSYVRNSPPIFEYFDRNGNKIIDYPARLVDTKMIKIFLVINVNPNRPPQDFQLESSVQLRNLEEE